MRLGAHAADTAHAADAVWVGAEVTAAGVAGEDAAVRDVAANRQALMARLKKHHVRSAPVLQLLAMPEAHAPLRGDVSLACADGQDAHLGRCQCEGMRA